MQKKNLRRLIRCLVFMGLYFMVGIMALFLAYLVRFDGVIPDSYRLQMVQLVLWSGLVHALAQIVTGQINILRTFFSLVDLRSILIANTLSAFVIFVFTALIGVKIPRGVMVLYLILLTGAEIGVRVALRFWGERSRDKTRMAKTGAAAVKPIAIVGAGEAGAAIVRELLNKPALRMCPVVIFDDDPIKWHQTIHGVPIVGKPESMKDGEWGVRLRKVIIALPTAKVSRISEIVRLCGEIGVPSETMPALDQLVAGMTNLSQLRPMQIEDLLRRRPVELDQAGVRGLLRNQVVVVTGAGGSIGSELSRQILAQSPRSLLLIERSEAKLFQIEQELVEGGGRNIIVPLVADICDPVRIREAFLRHQPAIIFHAAAHKHVPMMESQPGEAVRNNSIGTANLARIANETGVERFVLISTDKAVNPTNVMGASKRLAEIYLQAFQAANPGPTRFMAVRFGNVLGSSGSVVITFQKQIASGGPVTVTHREMIRYFMTVSEATALVLQAGSLGQGGEVFVLDMGEPVKILDLATQMIELSGYRVGEDIEIKFSGLRPGEKMFEELSHPSELLIETSHPKIYRYNSEPPDLAKVEDFFNRLSPKLYSAESFELKQAIQDFVPEYCPYVQ